LGAGFATGGTLPAVGGFGAGGASDFATGAGGASDRAADGTGGFGAGGAIDFATGAGAGIAGFAAGGAGAAGFAAGGGEAGRATAAPRKSSISRIDVAPARAGGGDIGMGIPSS
jgi:hypothetical protein